MVTLDTIKRTGRGLTVDEIITAALQAMEEMQALAARLATLLESADAWTKD